MNSEDQMRRMLELFKTPEQLQAMSSMLEMMRSMSLSQSQSMADSRLDLDPLIQAQTTYLPVPEDELDPHKQFRQDRQDDEPREEDSLMRYLGIEEDLSTVKSRPRHREFDREKAAPLKRNIFTDDLDIDFEIN
jgi:hypothetical protein